MKILNIVLAIMFAGFAYLQLNDPDPLIWTVIYLIMTSFSVLAVLGYYPRRFYWIVLGLLALYSSVYIPGVIDWLKSDNKAELFSEVAKMDHLYIEESREFLGLMICVAVLTFHILKSKK